MKRKSIPVTPPRETPEQFEARLEVESYQFRFNELLILTFKNAVQLIEAVAVLDPPHLRREFSNAFEAYERAQALIPELEKSNRPVKRSDKWLDPQWYDRTKRDLFGELAPDTQNLLRQQGLQL